jgi:hypothetical protein
MTEPTRLKHLATIDDEVLPGTTDPERAVRFPAALNAATSPASPIRPRA